MRAVFNEDRAIFDAQQRGIQASPHRGVIGTREERIHIFQRYLCERMALEVTPHPDSSEKNDDVQIGCTPSCDYQPSEGQA